jgi:hypothetical protein
VVGDRRKAKVVWSATKRFQRCFNMVFVLSSNIAWGSKFFGFCNPQLQLGGMFSSRFRPLIGGSDTFPQICLFYVARPDNHYGRYHTYCQLFELHVPSNLIAYSIFSALSCVSSEEPCLESGILATSSALNRSD